MTKAYINYFELFENEIKDKTIEERLKILEQAHISLNNVWKTNLPNLVKKFNKEIKQLQKESEWRSLPLLIRWQINREIKRQDKQREKNGRLVKH